MKKIKILVLEGGFNEEHEVSLSTGKEIKRVLKNLGINYQTIIVDPKTFEYDINKYNSDYVCFNALHGTFGEDGKIQRILDKTSLRYTHSGAKASHVCFNKKLTKESIKDIKILTPDFFTIYSNKLNEKILHNFFDKFGSFIIKPIASGSSYGIKIFRTIKEIKIFVKNIKKNLNVYKNHSELLIEKFIEGRELTVAVIQKNNQSFPVEVTEIISQKTYFDYESKYTPGFSKHILPAKIPKIVYENCKKFAKMAHDKHGCKAISRSDFIYNNKQLFFLEINNQPGLTSISLVPEQLKYQDISFDNLILNIINCAL